MRLADRVLYRLLVRDLVAPWQWPKGASEAEWKPVSFSSPSGPPIVGVFGRAVGVARGAVVCAHPVRPDAKGYFLRSGVADVLRDLGFDVLLFDFNGFGESPRHDFDYARDVLAAAHEAQRRSPGVPLVFFGACFGAGSALTILTRNDNPFVAVVAEGAPASWASYFTAPLSTRLTLRQRLIRLRGRALIRVGSWLHPRLARQHRTLHYLREARRLRGVLFLYGTDDPLIPAQVGEDLYAACHNAWQDRPDAPACRLWVSPPARHLMYYHADPEGYRTALAEFFDTVVAMPAPQEAL